MMLVKWWFLLLAIPPIEGSLRFWKPKDSSAEVRVTKQILETCYEDNGFKELIFILGDFNESIDNSSVIRMKNLLNLDKDYESHQYSSIGVTKVFIIENSSEKLYSDLTSFKKTKWWNHMLPFFIIGKNNEQCENFKEILNTAWKMDIINSIHICSESENTTLYTLNPITNYAPHPWKRMRGFNDSNIYHQVFDPHTSCSNLNYDKTKVLNGYQIKANWPLLSTNLTMEYSIDKLYVSPEEHLFHFVIGQMNARIMYEHGNVNYSLSQNLVASDLDVTWLVLDRAEAIKGQPLFTIEERNEVVVLVKFNEQTVLYKISHLWSTRVLCAAAIALIILFLILLIKNGEVTSAMLDIVRFLTYVSIRTDTRSTSFRIYFTTMLIFIVISNGVFQGKISAFLTKPDKVPTNETIQQLVDSEYHFYVHYMSRWSPPKSIVTLLGNENKCIEYVLNGTHNACIIPLYLYERYHLLKSLDRVSQFHSNVLMSWKSRRNWPLYERFNCMLMRIIESGIYAEWTHEKFYVIENKLKANDYELALAEIVTPYRPIELLKLNFAFELLAIGLSLATFVLIVELKMREI